MLLSLGHEIVLPIERQMQNEPQEDPNEVAAAPPEKLKGKVSYGYTYMEEARVISKHDHDCKSVKFKFKIGDIALISYHPLSSSEDRKVASLMENG